MAQISLPENESIINLVTHSSDEMTSADIVKLKQLLSGKRVVMLGEATHGDGNAQEAKTIMIRFLHEQLGFNVLAFESGFYDLFKANKNISAGYPFKEALSNSVFSVWINSKQCQELWQYLEKNRHFITLAGFDPQLSASYGRNMIADLEDFLEKTKTGADPDFDLLEATVQYMADHFSFPREQDYSKFEKELNQVIAALNKISSPAADVAFWKQAMKSTMALAADYYHNDPSRKTEETFKASDSNPRDRQMALNLLFLLKQYPNEKIICWGATSHFINNPGVFQDDELSKYVPMGKLLKEVLSDKLFVIGTTAGSGSYGIFENKIKQLQPEKKSLEEKLAGTNLSWSIVPLNKIKPSEFTSLAIEHKSLTGKWADVLDAVLYIPHLLPSVYYREIPVKKDAVSQQTPDNPLTQTTAVKKRAGKVVNEKDDTPVPFASIRIKSLVPVTLVSNNAGMFEWPADSPADSIEISSIGYKTMVRTTSNLQKKDTTYFKLAEDHTTLRAVLLTSLEKDPVKIMKKVIDNRTRNLPLKDFSMSMYVHEALKEKNDTVRDVEYITGIYSKNGYDKGFFIQAGLTELKWNKPLADSLLQKTGAIVNAANTAYLKTFSRIDYLYALPLFNDKNKLKYYQLKLDSMTTFNDERVFVISFNSKRKSERFTFSFNTARFYGTVYINVSDYAILKYEISVEGDTVSYNASAKKFFSRAVFGNNDRFFWSLLKSEDIMSRNAIYAKRGEIYVPVYISLVHRQKGMAQLTRTPVCYLGSAEYYLYNFSWGNQLAAGTIETTLSGFSRPANPFFWNNFIKPVRNIY